jgi:hypothetical protein
MLKNVAITITFGPTHRQEFHKKTVERFAGKKPHPKQIIVCPSSETSFYKSSTKSMTA